MEGKVIIASIFSEGKGHDFGKLTIAIDDFIRDYGQPPSIIITSEFVYDRIKKSFWEFQESNTVNFFGIRVIVNMKDISSLNIELH